MSENSAMRFDRHFDRHFDVKLSICMYITVQVVFHTLIVLYGLYQSGRLVDSLNLNPFSSINHTSEQGLKIV